MNKNFTHKEIPFKHVVEKILSPNEEIKYQFSIGERYLKIMKIVTIVIGSVILAGASLFLYHFPELHIITIILIIGACLALVIGGAHFYFGWFLRRSNIYLITNKRIVIHKGWLYSDLKSIGFQEITDIKIQQSFFDNLFFNTGFLKINTAGMNMYETILPHIEEPFKIKTRIIEFKHSLSGETTQKEVRTVQ